MPSAEDPTAPQRGMDSASNRYPVPDPTILTTQQLHREVLALRDILESRLDGMDKAIDLIQRSVDKSPTIAEIYAEFTEKFNSVKTQFTERDTRTEQTARDSKVAVDAALQAAKEAFGEQNKSSSLAISKSEAATMKQIDQIGANIQTLERSINDKIGDLKDRLNALQVPVNTAQGHAQGSVAVWGYVFALIMMGIAILTVVVRAYK